MIAGKRTGGYRRTSSARPIGQAIKDSTTIKINAVHILDRTDRSLGSIPWPYGQASVGRCYPICHPGTKNLAKARQRRPDLNRDLWIMIPKSLLI